MDFWKASIAASYWPSWWRSIPSLYQSLPSRGALEFLCLDALTNPSTLPEGAEVGVQTAGTASSGSALASGAGVASVAVSGVEASADSTGAVAGRNPAFSETGLADFEGHSCFSVRVTTDMDSDEDVDVDVDSEVDVSTRDDVAVSIAATSSDSQVISASGANSSARGAQGDTKPITVAAPARAITARRAWPRDSPP